MEKIPFERYLACDGKTYQVNGVKYKIRAKLRTQKYPYVRDYVDLTAEYKETDKSLYGIGRVWFMDLKASESDTCEKLFARMEKDLTKVKE